MKKVVKKHYKIIMGVIIGLIISVPVVYAAQTVLTGNEVSYNGESSGSSKDNVQGAIDDLYQKINSYKEYIPNDNPNRNIVKAYKYDEENESNTYCVTGDEESCFITSCYDNYAKDSCPPGTIIEYKVNDDNENNIIRFHVVHDDGKKLTLQSQKNIVSNVWYSKENIDTTNECQKCDNTKGPLLVLNSLENETSDWDNVNIFDYSIGDNNTTLGYSGCRTDGTCNAITYILNKQQVKSRMITMQEVTELGCKFREKSCPIWMYNYLVDSMTYGGTINDINAGEIYWIMSVLSDFTHAYAISSSESITVRWTTESRGARAVVEINK